MAEYKQPARAGMFKKIVTGLLLGAMLLTSVNWPAIAATVKRDAAPTEADIAKISGLQMWFDANDFGSDTQKVTTWENKADPDLEGAGDAVQTNPSRAPQYVAESRLNGLPAVRMETSSFLQVGGSNGFYLDDMTIIVVGTIDYEEQATMEIMSRLDNTNFLHNWYFNCEQGKFNFGWTVGDATAKSYIQARVPFTSGRANIFVGRKSEGTGNSIVNGEVLGTCANSAPTVKNSSQVYLGSAGGNTADADYGEILIFNRGLTDAELQTVNDYLYAKWGFESLDGNLLDSITYQGQKISGFSSYQSDYAILARGEVSESDFGFTARFADAKVETAYSPNGIAFTVTHPDLAEARKYTVQFRRLADVENRYTRVGIENVQLNSGFWKDTITQYVTHSMDYIFDMYDFSKSFDNFDRIAAGQRKTLGNTDANAGLILIPCDDNRLIGSVDGAWAWGNEPWREGLIYEAMRAVSDWIIQYEGSNDYSESIEALKIRMEAYVERIYAAALTTTGVDKNGKNIDGYFSTFTLLTQGGVLDETESGHVWTHDLWNYGGLVEFAISWYQATGDTRMLFAATRFTEFLIDYMYGPNGLLVVPSHQLAEEPLLRLYDLYKNNPDLVAQMEAEYDGTEGLSQSDRYYRLKIRWERYIDIVKDWIEKRGVYDGRYNNVAYGDYAQDHATYDQQTAAAGHSVRANLWYSAIADIGDYLDNEDYLSAANVIWNNIVNKQMYVTGGTGSVHGSESYGGDYYLPHDGYCETCASVGMAFFAGNMAEAFGSAEYADVLELELYNGILGCMGMDGMSFYYQNPMTSSDYQRPFWSGATPCCPPMYMKFFANLAGYIYMSNSDSIIVDQYIASTANITVGGVAVELTQATSLPNGNTAVFEVVAEGSFALRLRMPSWAKSATVRVNGDNLAFQVDADGYIAIERTWTGTTVVDVTFGMEVERVYQENVAMNQNQVAFRYGPFIYCAETEDNLVNGEDMLSKTIFVPKTAGTAVTYDESIFSLSLGEGAEPLTRGVNLMRVDAIVDGEEAVLTLIPFYLRTNRSMHKMSVFFWEESNLRGGKEIYDFEGEDTGFTILSGFTQENGALKTNALEEYKAILNGYDTLTDFRAEVEMWGASGSMNSGIYILAKNADVKQDIIDAYNIQVERAAGAAVCDLVLFQFSSAGGYLGALSRISNIPFPANGVVKLSVTVYDGVISASINGTEYMRHSISGKLEGGAVGLRAQRCATYFDNFTLTCEQIALHTAALSEKLAEAKALVSAEYRPESREVLAEAIAKAEKNLAEAICDDELERALTQLNEALASLQKLPVMTALEAQIAQAEALDRSLYKEESLADFIEALRAAKALTADNEQSEVDAALAQLTAALEALVLKTNLTALAELIAQAQAIDMSQYTLPSATALQIALNAARTLTEDNSQAEVDGAAKTLSDALAGMEKLPDTPKPTEPEATEPKPTEPKPTEPQSPDEGLPTGAVVAITAACTAAAAGAAAVAVSLLKKKKK